MKPFITYSVIFLVSIFQISCSTENFNKDREIEINVKFPFPVTNVEIYLWQPVNQIIKMNQETESFYSYIIYDSYESILFNIKYDIPQYNIYNYWVAAGNSYTQDLVPNRFDSHGIKYAKISVNGEKIDHTFTQLNNSGNGLNISLKINPDNTIEPLYTSGEFLLFDSSIPSEVHHRYQYCNKQLPESDHIEVAGWLAALYNDEPNIDTNIMIDYIMLFGRNNNTLKLLAKNDYAVFDPSSDGGLYLRYPFFPEGYDEHEPLIGAASNGVLTIVPTASPDKVWHLWTPQFLSLSGFNYDSYRIECRLRIQGNVIIQAGIDFRDENKNVSELGASNWYFEDNGIWQNVVFDSKSF